MRLIKTEMWERLIFDDNSDGVDAGKVFKSPHGMFVTVDFDLNVWNESEVRKAYSEKNITAFEILKQGTPPAEHVWIGQCVVCLSEVKAKYSALHHIDWSAEGEGYATCPFCQQYDIKFTRRLLND